MFIIVYTYQKNIQKCTQLYVNYTGEFKVSLTITNHVLEPAIGLRASRRPSIILRVALQL